MYSVLNVNEITENNLIKVGMRHHSVSNAPLEIC